MKKRTAIYARVSTEEQKKNYSIGEQIEQLEDYCERQDWEIAERYIDPGFSGANTNRPALKKMLSEIKSFDIVVVWKLDRLSRSIIDTMTIIERDLLAKKVQFVALAENINTESSTWITQAGIYSTIAQSEREAITERMQMGKLARAKSGKPMSWANPPFGYRYTEDRQSYTIDPLEADVVKDMFNFYDEIGSVTRLRNYLNDQGHVGKNVKWSYRTVKQILENPVYMGYNRYKGEIYKGNHEPIVDKELFEHAQQLMEKRRIEAQQTLNPRPFQGKYMLSGQISCGYCGASLEVSQYTTVDGTKHMRYGCRNRIHANHGAVVYNGGKKCHAKIHQMKEIENYVVSEISKLQLNPTLVAKYSQEENVRLSELKDYEKQLEKNKRDTDKLINLYMNELISSEELESKSNDLKKEKKYLEAKVTELNSEENSAVKYLESKPKNIHELSYDEKKRVVELLIEKTRVTDDSITIEWAF